MTSKLIYEATAIELSKVQAPALKLYEFNYFFNQAIRLYVNKIYNIYDVNQLTTDDLRVLKSTATLLPVQATSTGNNAVDYLRGATYFVDMPDDYLHLLNCICLFDVNKRKECWDKGDVMVVGATKLTADSWSSVVDDVYNRPTKKKPYYYIHNQNDIYTDSNQLIDRNSKLPTNINTDSLHGESYDDWYDLLAKLQALGPGATKSTIISALQATKAYNTITVVKDTIDDIANDTTLITMTDIALKLYNMNPVSVPKSNFARTFDFDANGNNVITPKDVFSTIEKPAGSRHANSSKVRIEIRCGRDNSNTFSLSAVQIDYVKAPQFIRLTQEQLDSDEDISQIMEFPDYVNQEIINELVNLIMRKTNDPSLNTHLLITLSIARPTGQLQQTAALA